MTAGGEEAVAGSSVAAIMSDWLSLSMRISEAWRRHGSPSTCMGSAHSVTMRILLACATQSPLTPSCRNMKSAVWKPTISSLPSEYDCASQPSSPFFHGFLPLAQLEHSEIDYLQALDDTKGFFKVCFRTLWNENGMIDLVVNSITRILIQEFLFLILFIHLGSRKY